jgi:hypothetical protein
MKKVLWSVGLIILFVFTHDGGVRQAPAGVPVFAFDKAKSSIGLNVKASVAIAGKFDKWDATMTFNRGAVLNEARSREKSAIT